MFRNLNAHNVLGKSTPAAVAPGGTPFASLIASTRVSVDLSPRQDHSMPGKMDCYGQTDVGLKRADNQDQFLIADLNKAMRIHHTSLGLDNESTLFGNSQGVMLLVADGMGGHASGEQASRLAVESLTSSILNTMPWFFSRDAEGDEDLKHSLERALHRCQHRLTVESAASPSSEGMGTTLTAAYLNWPRTTVVHAGDSRCYLWRAGKLTQITKDHTLAQQLSDGGAFRSSDLSHSRWAHMLWNAIGAGNGDVQPEIHQFDLEIGDVLFLCTDGLTRHVEPAELAERMKHMLSAKQLCRDLVELANERGGADNITVVAAHFVDKAPATLKAESAAVEEPEPGPVDPLSDTKPEVQTIPEEPATVPAAHARLKVKSHFATPKRRATA
jgi:serine/threonine protein phosphatase PrpC